MKADSLRAEVEALRKENARLVSECATLKVGWAEFERVSLRLLEEAARARDWAHAWKRMATWERKMTRLLRAQVRWLLVGRTNDLANEPRRG